MFLNPDRNLRRNCIRIHAYTYTFQGETCFNDLFYFETKMKITNNYYDKYTEI